MTNCFLIVVLIRITLLIGMMLTIFEQTNWMFYETDNIRRVIEKLYRVSLGRLLFALRFPSSLSAGRNIVRDHASGNSFCKRSRICAKNNNYTHVTSITM